MKWHYIVLKKFLWDRDGGCCKLCGESFTFEQATIDHAVPTKRGGQDEMSNLQLAHRLCNISKGARMLTELIPRTFPVTSSRIQFNIRLNENMEKEFKQTCAARSKSATDVVRQLVREWIEKEEGKKGKEE
jgi:hypothetical protein